MKKLVTVLVSLSLIVVFSLSAQAGSIEVEGVMLPETLEVGEHELVFNGAGKRSRWMMSVYVSALYLTEPSSNAREIIESDEAKAITLRITSDRITRERMINNIEEGFELATGGNTSAIRAPIDQLLSAFDREIEDGDWVELLYLPERGVLVRHNDEEVGQVKGEPEFREALFAIWLGEDPGSETLKKEMLGK